MFIVSTYVVCVSEHIHITFSMYIESHETVLTVQNTIYSYFSLFMGIGTHIQLLMYWHETVFIYTFWVQFFLSTISLSHSLTHTCMRAHMYGIECTTVRIYEAKRHNREDVWVETKLNQRDEIKKPKICKRKKSISATYLTAHYLVLQCFLPIRTLKNVRKRQKMIGFFLKQTDNLISI